MPFDPAVVRDNLLDYGTRTFWALIVAAVALLIARTVRGITMRALARSRAQANVTVLVGNLAQLAVIAIGVLLILAIYTQGAFAWILTSFSVVGIVIGLSAQDILKNFFAGLWVLIERPFRIGDSIEVTGYTGMVEGISFRTTQLRTDDGREIIVPNGTFMTSAVANLTRFPARRASALLTLPADEKPVTTEDIRSALAKADGVSPEPPPSVELRGVADGKVQYLVSFWASNREAALAQALPALRARFPQGDVHIG